jgi:CopG antitoxin of type II toxin-antitoxin system
MKKKLPVFKTDDEAARFLDRKDLSDYINIENMVPTHFEFERRAERLARVAWCWRVGPEHTAAVIGSLPDGKRKTQTKYQVR